MQSVLKAIIHGELASGARLITNNLAVRLGVSATPIREALVELEQLGIVELLHHRGAIVKPFGRKEVHDFYAVRRLLECEAVRLGSCHVDSELLGSLRGDLERLIAESANGHEKSIKDLVAVDHRVHRMFIDHCSNRRLIAEIERYRSLSDTMRELVEYNHVCHHEAIVPLLALLEATYHGRADAGVDAMERHINIVAATVETLMFDGKKDQIN